MQDPQTFRTNVLTILGAIAFIIFLVMMVLRALGTMIPYSDMFVVLTLASVLLGVDLTGTVLSNASGGSANSGGSDKKRQP